mmetsp:Transcript_86559/g.181318  ORF Transcript_86559/g.181318 Transcript_86559/m.181318 type:complete len:203 (+) Transcript_86559:1261-1869(+)
MEHLRLHHHWYAVLGCLHGVALGWCQKPLRELQLYEGPARPKAPPHHSIGSSLAVLAGFTYNGCFHRLLKQISHLDSRAVVPPHQRCRRLPHQPCCRRCCEPSRDLGGGGDQDVLRIPVRYNVFPISSNDWRCGLERSGPSLGPGNFSTFGACFLLVHRFFGPLHDECHHGNICGVRPWHSSERQGCRLAEPDSKSLFQHRQ